MTGSYKSCEELKSKNQKGRSFDRGPFDFLVGTIGFEPVTSTV
jgi:hypothetical protein